MGVNVSASDEICKPPKPAYQQQLKTQAGIRNRQLAAQRLVSSMNLR
jgi:hypothetical protein